MTNLINDFNVFLSFIFESLTSLWNWFTNNLMGEILIFLLLISLFFFLVNEIKSFRR